MSPKSAGPIPMVDLRAQYASIRNDIRAAIDSVLESQSFILGREGEALETEIARFCGTRFAVGVASGTDALLLALHAAGVRPGDEVIVPAFTFIATASTVSLLGAVPVFADIHPDTFNLDPRQVLSRITPRTRAIIAVHLYGQPADMDAILQIARPRALTVIEDAAQALGATYKGRSAGSIADLGCISFFPSKNLGAAGDAGMIVTAREDFAQRLRILRNHGSSTTYSSTEQGWNSRLDEIQAAILRAKLPHLESWNSARRANADVYDSALGSIPGLVTARRCASCEHIFHQYTVRLQHRDRVHSKLGAAGIASRVYYPVPLHLQPMFCSLGYRRGDLPESERACSEVLSLPMYPELTREQIARVANGIRSAIGA